tara:strand:- start:91 stop:465 length:375 start_codon:yes stop_codon:yes gene_type:complete
LAVQAATNSNDLSLLTIFLGVFSVLEIMSQEFHRAAHTPKNKTHPILNFTMDKGLTINRKQHTAHHKNPYDGNYCIVSGVWNEWLDDNLAWRWMEKRVFDVTGVEPNSWKLDETGRNKKLAMKF